MAPHSSTLAWKISWTEEPGQSLLGKKRYLQDKTNKGLLSRISEGLQTDKKG